LYGCQNNSVYIKYTDIPLKQTSCFIARLSIKYKEYINIAREISFGVRIDDKFTRRFQDSLFIAEQYVKHIIRLREIRKRLNVNVRNCFLTGKSTDEYFEYWEIKNYFGIFDETRVPYTYYYYYYYYMVVRILLCKLTVLRKLFDGILEKNVKVGKQYLDIVNELESFKQITG